MDERRTRRGRHREWEIPGFWETVEALRSKKKSYPEIRRLLARGEYGTRFNMTEAELPSVSTLEKRSRWRRKEQERLEKERRALAGAQTVEHWDRLLAYARALRLRLVVPLPGLLAPFTAQRLDPAALWQGRDTAGAEVTGIDPKVDEAWRWLRWNAREHPLWTPLQGHLGRTYPLVDALATLEAAICVYYETCSKAYGHALATLPAHEHKGDRRARAEMLVGRLYMVAVLHGEIPLAERGDWEATGLGGFIPEMAGAIEAVTATVASVKSALEPAQVWERIVGGRCPECPPEASPLRP